MNTHGINISFILRQILIYGWHLIDMFLVCNKFYNASVQKYEYLYLKAQRKTYVNWLLRSKCQWLDSAYVQTVSCSWLTILYNPCTIYYIIPTTWLKCRTWNITSENFIHWIKTRISFLKKKKLLHACVWKKSAYILKQSPISVHTVFTHV